MAQIIQKISVDVTKPNFFAAIVAKQHDSNSRFLKATFIHESKEVAIPTTSTVTINAKRNDGEKKSFAGRVNDDNTVTVPLAYWMLELVGTVKCDISVIDTDGSKLTSTAFILEVEEASCDSGGVSEDEDYNVLVKLIEDVSKLTPDQTYNPESERPQSGKAVAQALSGYGGGSGGTGPNGKSAYQIALDNGFEGTETEWLESLKGKRGSNGADGFSPTAKVEQTDNGADIAITDKNGTTKATVLNGLDGISATHSWDGTVLTVTSASGTSSANLKGDRGDTGANGTNGTSVTVKSVSESTADGGSNVVTFSDGKTVTIKNGSKGSTGATGDRGADGKTPVKGTDYYTEADKTEMVNDVKKVCVAKNQGSANVGKILAVGTDGNLVLVNMPEGGASGDVIGVLDESNNILLSGNLTDGTYTLKYENADGTYTDVGTLEVGATPDTPDEPEVIINQIPISTDASGNLFVGTNGEKGYKTDYRLSLSSGDETAATDYECTGFIPAKQNDVIRIKNIDLTSENATNIIFYNSDKTPIKGSASTYGLSLYGFFVTSGTEENGVYTSTLDGDRHNAIETGDLAYIRIGSKSITDESILTVNQEIVSGAIPDTPDEPTYTNLFNSSTCELNMRLNSSGASTEGNGYILTDYIAIPDGVAVGNFRIRYKNAELYQSKSRVGLYNSSKQKVDVQYINGTTLYATGTDDNGVKYVDVLLAEKITASAYVRIAFYSGADTAVSASDAENIIVTINEEIV